MRFTGIDATFIWLLALCCFTNTSTNNMKADSVLTYSAGDLHQLRNLVYCNHSRRTIDPVTCATIRQLRLSRRRKRGRNRRKRREKLNYLRFDNIKRAHANNICIPFLLLNARSIKAWTFLIRDELDTNHSEFAAFTETWLRKEDVQWAECSQLNKDGIKIPLQYHT